MARRAPFLLTSLRLATKQPTTAEPAEMAGLLAGWLRLWTAAILRDAARRPRLADPTDHDAAHADGLYLIPDQAPPTLAGRWSERARQAGAELLPAGPGDPAELERDTDLAALGLGVLLLDTLTEAMDHMPTLDEEAFWAQVQTAATSEDAPRQEALRAAADLLRQAREALYPSQLTLLELTLLADLPPADWRPGPLPANLLLSGSLLERWATDRPEQFALVHQELVQQRLEIVAGPWDDRDDLLAPLVLQEENLRRGLASYRRHLGHDPFVYGQVAAGLGPQTPQQLLAEEVRHALLTPLGPGGLPPFRGAVLEWPARDGQSITAHVRPWHGRELPTALFNLPCQLHETIMQDFAAVH
ncbi:MAG TPA: hypothetical protein PKD86_18710, partial [Gemmatales bacterium]|nr:hypothetical protein [Gemmatales bacterium]